MFNILKKGNATEPPPKIRMAEHDTHEYPHEDIWPSGCFVMEGDPFVPSHERKPAQLIFNTNFESEAECTDSGDVTGSMRCLCRPERKGNNYYYCFFGIVHLTTCINISCNYR